MEIIKVDADAIQEFAARRGMLEAFKSAFKVELEDVFNPAGMAILNDPDSDPEEVIGMVCTAIVIMMDHDLGKKRKETTYTYYVYDKVTGKVVKSGIPNKEDAKQAAVDYCLEVGRKMVDVKIRKDFDED